MPPPPARPASSPKRLAERALALLGPEGPIAAVFADYEARSGQLAMARRVAEALDGDERLLCEAGTGTGKTLAYLVPALLSERKVVISTGSKTLQDQIARVDLPRLLSVLDEPVSFTVMKGLSNYVCLRRLQERARQTVISGTEGETEAQLQRIVAWVATAVTGDRAELDSVPDEAPIWREVVATPETRLGSRCGFFRDCFVTRMREAALDARIVVTNHHLFFADLALRQTWPDAQVLPPYDVAIFDEAHQLEEIATEFFGLHVSTQRLHALARDVGRLPPSARAGEHGATLARRLSTLSEQLGRAVRARLPQPRAGTDELRVPMPPELWTDDSGKDDGPRQIYFALDAALEELAAFSRRLAEHGPPGITPHADPPPPDVASVLHGIGRRASALRDELGELVESGHTYTGSQVRWVVASPRNVSLRASPIDVAPLLERAWDLHPGPLVFTSATLSVGESFDYVRARLGLYDSAADAVFASPFRFSEQALVYVPEDLPDPNQDGFAEAVSTRVLELCEASRGRALCLFTSFRNLHAAEVAFRAHGRFPLLVQGTRPKHALLSALRTELGSVLLATQSFWEGVDVPGEALSLVVMDRIPFAVPDDPLAAARCKRIKEQGGDPFTSYQLPRAALALRQGFGRLIRTRSDRGVVALLDGRLLRKTYGLTLLSSLPANCARTTNLDDVRAFFAAQASRGPNAPQART